MKKLFAVFTVCLLCLCFTIPALADKSSDSPLLMDDSGVLTDEEYKNVLNALESSSSAAGANICVAFVPEEQSYDIQDSADLYYEDHWGMNTDGILMYVDTVERNYIFSTSGNTIYCFTQTGLNEMTDDITGGFLRNSDWAGAAIEYSNQAREMIDYKNANGYAYGERGSGRSSKNAGMTAVIAIIVGIVVSMILSGNLKKKMQTVVAKASASDYYDPDKMVLKAQKDTFLFTNVTKVPINNDKSSGGGFGGHTSSSGGFHGGGGGGRF